MPQQEEDRILRLRTEFVGEFSEAIDGPSGKRVYRRATELPDPSQAHDAKVNRRDRQLGTAHDPDLVEAATAAAKSLGMTKKAFVDVALYLALQRYERLLHEPVSPNDEDQTGATIGPDSGRGRPKEYVDGSPKIKVRVTLTEAMVEAIDAQLDSGQDRSRWIYEAAQMRLAGKMAPKDP